NHQLTARNPDQRAYIPLQEKVLRRYMKQAQINQLPADLGGYLRFISRILAENQKNGGIAMKFEAAYFRPLHFGDPPRSQAEAIPCRTMKYSGVKKAIGWEYDQPGRLWPRPWQKWFPRAKSAKPKPWKWRMLTCMTPPRDFINDFIN